MRLTGLHVHPLKSGAIRPVHRADVRLGGLADDRSWMVVDGDGSYVNAGMVRGMLRIVADARATAPDLGAALVLRAEGHPDLAVDVPEGAPETVWLDGLELRAVAAAEGAHAWLRAVLDRPDLRLVWSPSSADHTAFTDLFAVSVATEASLGRLNEWIAEAAVERGEEVPDPLPMQRFRPNLVLDGDEPFAEDGWNHVWVGDVRFRVAQPSGRCVITAIDPSSLRSGKEPIRTLSRHRLSPDRKALFAAYLVPETTGEIRVGDAVSVS